MSTGADNKTMPVTREYEDGYDRIFGKDHQPERGRFIWDKAKHKFVRPEEYQADTSEAAINAPIMVDRFYENTQVVGTGEDIGSRRKHREYMKRNGLTTADDFTDTWAKAEKEREQARQGIFPDRKERREELGRIHYEVEKKHARRRK